MNAKNKRKTGHPLRRVAAGLMAIMGRFKSIARRRYTVMLIPHSASPARTAQVNLVTLMFLATLAAAILTGGIYLMLNVEPTTELVQRTASELDGIGASLEAARAQIGEIDDVLSEFEHAIRAMLGPEESTNGQSYRGSLYEFLGVSQESDTGESTVGSLGEAIETLKSFQRPLASLTDALILQRQVMSDLPMLWPITNRLGRLTMEFGPNVHPIGAIWYMHKGVDIAYMRGTPVVATGNGIVTAAGFDTLSGYGGYVEIAHPYGFSTKYAHLDNVRVGVGDAVRQGDTIGLLGSSGLATGPNVHYEVTVGTEVIDPAPLLKIDKPSFLRRVDNRS